MTLLAPEFLMLLFAIAWLRLKKRSARISGPCKAAHSAKSAALLYGAMILMVLSLSRPAIVHTQSSEKLEGFEATIALDLSYSMRAKDISPTRLEAAKATIRKILQKDLHDRFALYGFTTRTLILSPPTTDHTLLLAALDSIVIENILTHGTSLERLLKEIAKRSAGQKSLILFTDGGEERDLKKLVEIARKGGIRTIAVAMASDAGSTLEDECGKKLKKADGSLVISRRNPLLLELAKETGGVYLPFKNADKTADAVLEALKKISVKTDFSIQTRSYVELFWIPLAIALILILLAWVRLPKKILVLLPFLAVQSDAGILDWYYIRQAQKAYHEKRYREGVEALERLSRPTLQSRFDQALMLYKKGAYREAIAILESLQSKDPRLKQKILFLLGNAYAKRKAYDKARYAYLQALVLGRDPDILYNLRLIADKRAKKQKKPPVYKKSGQNHLAFAAKQKPKKSNTKSGSQKSKTKRALTRPLGYKAYEMINKGYIDEKNPW